MLYFCFATGFVFLGLFRASDLGELEADFCVPSQMLVATMVSRMLFAVERDTGSLWIAKMCPNRWYGNNDDGDGVDTPRGNSHVSVRPDDGFGVQNATTVYGTLSFHIHARANNTPTVAWVSLVPQTQSTIDDTSTKVLVEGDSPAVIHVRVRSGVLGNGDVAPVAVQAVSGCAAVALTVNATLRAVTLTSVDADPIANPPSFNCTFSVTWA